MAECCRRVVILNLAVRGMRRTVATCGCPASTARRVPAVTGATCRDTPRCVACQYEKAGGIIFVLSISAGATLSEGRVNVRLGDKSAGRVGDAACLPSEWLFQKLELWDGVGIGVFEVIVESYAGCMAGVQDTLGFDDNKLVKCKQGEGRKAGSREL